jgi:murein DD-endopeptidase MepM/ murein hydrolase activator NlpD
MLIFIVTCISVNLEAQAQGSLRLRVPFDGVYRINSYVDHQTPFDKNDNPITMFNGETYNNCPTAFTQWVNRGPYCRDGHEGIDWAIVADTPILAAASGTVIEVDEDPNGYGNFIRIDHGNGYVTRYAHLNDQLVAVSDDVIISELIGLSGNTGNSSGPHLHFDVFYNGSITDPFGWQGDSPDPLINYSGEAAICLWANDWCNETIVEDGDNSNDGTIKFQEVGSDWDDNNWSNQGNSWTMKYLPSGDGSSYGVYWPHLPRRGPYEVFAFIPAVHSSANVTYIIHAENTDFEQTINQADYSNEWVTLGSYNFGGGVNDYIRLNNEAASGEIAFDTIKFRQFQLYLPNVSKSDNEPPPDPNSCFVGRVLSADTFGDGDNDNPFAGSGTDDVHQQPWQRFNTYSGGTPFPENVERVNITLITWQSPIDTPGRYGLRFIDETNDNENLSDSLNDKFDQAMYKQINLPSGVTRLEVSFVLRFDTDETTPPPNTNETVPPFDFFYFDIFDKPPVDVINDTTNNLTSNKFECNNGTRCNPTNTVGGGVFDASSDAPNQWIQPTIPYHSAEFGNVSAPYMAFWANVNNDNVSIFFLDEFKVIITECE